MKTYLKFIIPFLIAVAIALGIIQRKSLPEFSLDSNANSTNFSQSTGDKSLEDYYKKSQEISQSANQQASTTITFLAVGDINLSRGVATAIQKANDPSLPFSSMSDVLKSTSFNFANLESPIAQKGKEIVGGHTLVFGAPFEYAQSLKDYNFKMLNLANNHALDLGLAGVDSTKIQLDSLGILHEGAGDNLDEAWKPAVINQDGIKICFVGASYSSINDGGKEKNNYVARIEDLERLKTAITMAKSECNFTVATMHAGVEYTRYPNDAQKTFAHAAINYGADIVIGAHPHWVQTIEKYCPLQSYSPLQGRDGGVGVTPEPPTTSPAPQGLPLKKEENTAECSNPKYIFYSLGNFIFDQSFSQDTSEGLTLKIQLSKVSTSSSIAPNAASGSDLQGSIQPAHLDSIELIPVIIKNSVPQPATEQETKSILSKIKQIENILK
jgi:poly-gamma-glutamate capsule biosynthesis protein CapA/YwtB (metallophosphatase superfamily)